MTKKHQPTALFDRSGNLTPEAMERYLSGQLTPEDRQAVEAHLEVSPFDREALEGFRKQDPEDFLTKVEELNELILMAAKDRTASPRITRIRRYYWAAAASLALLTGLTVLMVFMFQPSSDRQLTVDNRQSPVGSRQSAVGSRTPGTRNQEPGTRNQEPETRNQEPGTIGGIAMTDQKDMKSEQPPSVTDIPIQIKQPALEPQQLQYQVDADIVVSREKGDAVDEDLSADQSGRQVNSKRTGISRKEAVSNYGAQEARLMEVEQEDTTAGANQIFISVESMPEFPGGDTALSNYLESSIHYPDSARANGIQGRVFVTFIIEEDGSVSNVQLLRGIGGGCDEEAMRVIQSMPKWKPGKQRGQAVRVQFNLPVKFSL